MAKDKAGSKLDVVMKMGLVLFISLLSFAVGTFVGKKFSDNQHKVANYEHGGASAEKVAADSHEEGSRGVASVEENVGKSKESLTDDEIAKLAEEFVAEEGIKVDKDKEEDGDRHVASTHEEEKKGESAGHGSEKHGSEKAEKAEKSEKSEKSAHAKVEEKKSEGHEKSAAKEPSKVMKKNDKEEEHVEAKKEKSKPAKTAELASAADGKYTVQIASYPTENEAQKMTSGLKDKGFPAFYVTAKVKDKSWYRVSAGLFPTSDAADEYRKKLEKEGISKTIVQKVTN